MNECVVCSVCKKNPIKEKSSLRWGWSSGRPRLFLLGFGEVDDICAFFAVVDGTAIRIVLLDVVLVLEKAAPTRLLQVDDWSTICHLLSQLDLAFLCKKCSKQMVVCWPMYTSKILRSWGFQMWILWVLVGEKFTNFTVNFKIQNFHLSHH